MIKELISKFWLYLLLKVTKYVEKQAELSADPHVVYFYQFDSTVYVCPDGESAVILANKFKELHSLLNMSYMLVIYGSINNVYLTKLPKLGNIKFTWDVKDSVRKQVFDLILAPTFESNKITQSTELKV